MPREICLHLLACGASPAARAVRYKINMQAGPECAPMRQLALDDDRTRPVYDPVTTGPPTGRHDVSQPDHTLTTTGRCITAQEIADTLDTTTLKAI